MYFVTYWFIEVFRAHTRVYRNIIYISLSDLRCFQIVKKIPKKLSFTKNTTTFVFIGVVSWDFQGLMFRSETFISEEFCLSGGTHGGMPQACFGEGIPANVTQESYILHGVTRLQELWKSVTKIKYYYIFYPFTKHTITLHATLISLLAIYEVESTQYPPIAL